MKKWLFLVLFLLLSFIFYTIYLGFENEKLLKKLSQNQNYELTELELKKGFFTSRANFKLKDGLNLGISVKIELEFSNIFLKNDIIKGKVYIPGFLKNSSKNEEIASFKVNLKDLSLKLNIKDINSSSENGIGVLKGGRVFINFDKNFDFKNVEISFDSIDFSQFYDKFFVKNLKISYDKNLKARQNLSFNQLLLNKNKINSLNTKFSFNKTEQSINLQGSLKEFELNLGKFLNQNLHFAIKIPSG